MATIMVVDDAAYARGMCTKTLTQVGYQVVEAASGEEAIAKYKMARVDAVLLDITMPDMDGVQTLRELIEFDADARVAMCTAMDQQSIIIECLKAGAKDFLAKPFSSAQVVDMVEKMLGQASRLEERHPSEPRERQ